MNDFYTALVSTPLLWGACALSAFIGAILCALFMNYRLATARAQAIGLAQLLEERDAARQLQEQRYEQLQQEHRALDALNDDLNQKMTVAQTELRHLEATLATQQAQQQTQDARTDELASAHAQLQKQYVALQSDCQYKEQSLEQMRQQFAESRSQLTTEFQNLATRIFEEKEQVFSQNSRQSLEGLLRPFREQIDRFQARVNEVHDQSLQGHSMLRSQIGQLMDMGLKMTRDADALARALKGDKKALGNWGEMQLESALESAGLIKGEHFDTQVLFRGDDGKANYPDFVVFLPDGKQIVLDSKVSLVAYEQAINEPQEDARRSHLDSHVRAVRAHIEQLSAKDYTALHGMKSPGFVLMFMPVEGAYIEALRHSRNLFQYGYERGVILVSHTTLMPILRTVSYLWMMADSNQKALEIGEKATDIYNQVARVAEHLNKLGGTIGTLTGHYNAVVRSFAGNQGLTGKVERFNTLSAKAAKTMPDIQPVHADVDLHRLESKEAKPD